MDDGIAVEMSEGSGEDLQECWPKEPILALYAVIQIPIIMSNSLGLLRTEILSDFIDSLCKVSEFDRVSYSSTSREYSLNTMCI